MNDKELLMWRNMARDARVSNMAVYHLSQIDHWEFFDSEDGRCYFPVTKNGKREYGLWGDEGKDGFDKWVEYISNK